MQYEAQDIAERLEHRLGLGTRPTLRKALYGRLGRLCEELGDPAYYIIASVVADTDGKSDKGRYFCKVVMRRLIDRGILRVDSF